MRPCACLLSHNCAVDDLVGSILEVVLEGYWRELLTSALGGALTLLADRTIPTFTSAAGAAILFISFCGGFVWHAVALSHRKK